MCNSLENSPDTFEITSDIPPGAPRAGRQSGANLVVLDPNFHPPTETTCGVKPAPTEAILAHELGHLIGADDDGSANLNNVMFNENPVRLELGYPQRTNY